MPIRPFMPAAAWPGNVQRNSYVPVADSVTVIVWDCPPCSSFVTFCLPTQAFGAVVVAFRQMAKVWAIFPAFVTLNTTVPAGTFENFESLNASSEGLPAMTVIVVGVAAVLVAAA